MSAAPLRQQEPVRHETSRRHGPAGAPDSRLAPGHKPRPALRAVPAPAQARSIAPFAWLCISIIVAALGAVLVLNTAMTEGAYDVRDLKIEIASLHQERAAALTQLEANAAPASLAADAAALGMVPAERLGFVSLADDAVLGEGGGP